MLEAADLVIAGKHAEIVQDESRASYEGWCRAAEAKIYWASHVDFVYDLIRGTNPAPGAWTTVNGRKLQIFDARKHAFRTFGAVKGKPGEVSEVTDASFLKAKPDDGKKGSGSEVAAALGIAAGTVLGT
jgi:methionyl-tRNA formyltransferase